jgi:hypothetical protein
MKDDLEAAKAWSGASQNPCASGTGTAGYAFMGYYINKNTSQASAPMSFLALVTAIKEKNKTFAALSRYALQQPRQCSLNIQGAVNLQLELEAAFAPTHPALLSSSLMLPKMRVPAWNDII